MTEAAGYLDSHPRVTITLGHPTLVYRPSNLTDIFEKQGILENLSYIVLESLAVTYFCSCWSSLDSIQSNKENFLLRYTEEQFWEILGEYSASFPFLQGINLRLLRKPISEQETLEDWQIRRVCPHHTINTHKQD